MRPTDKTPYEKMLAGNVLPSGQPQFGLDPKVFDELIQGHGIRMIHAKPIPCPNRRTLTGRDHDPSCNKCHNGFLYFGHKEFIGVLMSNSNAKQFMLEGAYDVDQAVIAIPTTYTDGTEIHTQIFDQFKIVGETVSYYQLVEHASTGRDRLHFPATKIEKLVDWEFKEYYEGKDFHLDEFGYIVWDTPNRPMPNPEIDMGGIYGVSYWCKPVFTIVQLPHQLRATQAVNSDGQTVQVRLPQLAVVRKDFIPYDPSDKVGAPDVPSPADGGFNRP